MGPSIYVDYHAGYDFTIYVRQAVPGGRYIAEVVIRKDGAQALPVIRNDDRCWDTEEQAKEAMRPVAWAAIESLAKNS